MVGLAAGALAWAITTAIWVLRMGSTIEVMDMASGGVGSVSVGVDVGGTEMPFRLLLLGLVTFFVVSYGHWWLTSQDEGKRRD